MPNSLPQAFRQYFEDMQKNMHTCIPGTIKSFDASSCTATVHPSGKFKMPNGKFLDYPDVTEVPVCLVQSSGQDATIAYPIKEGDGCLIFFSEQQLDGWRDDQTPDTELRFDLSNAIALVGLVSAANPVMEDACNNDAIIIDREGTRVIIKKEQVTVLPKKDDSTHKVEVNLDSVNVECGAFTKLAMTDISIDMKCGEACSFGLSPAKISLTAPVIEVNGLATMVTSTAFGVNTVLFPVSTVPVPGAIPPVDEIPGVKEAISSAEEAVK